MPPSSRNCLCKDNYISLRKVTYSITKYLALTVWTNTKVEHLRNINNSESLCKQLTSFHNVHSARVSTQTLCADIIRTYLKKTVPQVN